MNEPRDTGFKSYILDDSSFESISLNDLQRTKFLDGESLVTEAQRVLMYAPLSDRKRATLGILTVTNFKLSFVSVNEKEDTDETYQRSLLLGPHEVCLSSIDTIYQIGDRSRKKLVPRQQISAKVKELAIICKNMRMFEFSFKFADKDNGKQIANALLHYSYPKIHGLLFAYEYKEPYYKTGKNIRYFRSADDWNHEMVRTGCKNWRITLANQDFQMSSSLPRALVVPLSVTDGNLNQAVTHFRNNCGPIWVWGTSSAALVRMSDLLPTITDRTQENIMLEHVRKSHAEKRQPYIMDLSKDCPSVKDIQLSYLKLRDLCIPESIRIFKTQDFKFYGHLDNTKWLLHVSTCLRKAVEGASVITKINPTTVVLQEGNGQDMNCVISSLIQLILDPCCRTVNGFQTLIQKEWVALGHPFCSRLGLVIKDENEASPLFLLFLDCVWQLLQQFPTAFQFTETYLTTIWDSVHINIFDTFLFNSEHDRAGARNSTGSNLTLRSVWDWKEQFMEKHIALFCNPLFNDQYLYQLNPKPAVAFLEIWTQCYSRWLPDIEIPNGGKPQTDLCSRFIASEIYILRQKLLKGDVNGTVNGTNEDGLQLLRKVNSFFPFSRNNGQVHGNLPLDNSLLSGDTLDTQSILNHSAAID